MACPKRWQLHCLFKKLTFSTSPLYCLLAKKRNSLELQIYDRFECQRTAGLKLSFSCQKSKKQANKKNMLPPAPPNQELSLSGSEHILNFMTHQYLSRAASKAKRRCWELGVPLPRLQPRCPCSTNEFSSSPTG